ncbi:tubulin folding cofactor c [Holotrichia oblita]|nr:tubulin folding cofactor c [Holotrichia oblita]
MLHKGAKSQNIRFVRKAATVLFVAEGLFFLGCYGVWHKLNTDRDFRKYMHQNYPSILEHYYSLSIKLGAPQHIKTTDFAVWEHQKE